MTREEMVRHYERLRIQGRDEEADELEARLFARYGNEAIIGTLDVIIPIPEMDRSE